MLNRPIPLLLELFGYSLIILGAGGLFWFLKKDTGLTFQDALFWVSVTPIALLSMKQLAGVGSTGGVNYHISQSTMDQSSIKRAENEYRDTDVRFKADLKWITAGVAVFLFSMLL